MFKGWSSWLSGELENEEKTEKPETVEEKNINTVESQAKGLGGETFICIKKIHICIYIICGSLKIPGEQIMLWSMLIKALKCPSYHIKSHNYWEKSLN